MICSIHHSFLALTLLILLFGCEHTQTEEEQQKQVLQTWSYGFETAGKALQAASGWEPLARALEVAAAEISTSSARLEELKQQGYPVSDGFVGALGDLANALNVASSGIDNSDLEAAARGASLVRAHFLVTGSLEPPSIPAAYREGAANLLSAEQAIRATNNPMVTQILAQIVSISPDEYKAQVNSVTSLTDPDLREWLQLDSPEIQAGLESLQSGAGVEELQEFGANSTNLIANATRERFAESFSRFGGNLIAIATGIGSPDVQFFSVWGDDCSPEGAKQNCSLGDIAITLCGNSPDDLEQILEFVDKLPFGHVAIRAALMIHRVTSTSDIYFQCSFERCDDTVCLPIVGTELEWVEHEDWIRVTNEGQDSTGAGGCWAPQLWTGPDRSRFRDRLRDVLNQECGCQ